MGALSRWYQLMIEAAFLGFLAADAEVRTSQAGKQWARLRVGVGKDDTLQWVSVAVFGKAVETAAELKKGDRCYVEGAIKLDTWRGNDGADRHGLAVTCFKIDKTHQIGRNKPKSEKPKQGFPHSTHAPLGNGATDLNDDLPF
jgi:single-stranded DNA-binding protein